MHKFQRWTPMEEEVCFHKKGGYFEKENDLEEERGFSLARTMEERREEELLNRSYKMLSDINEVTEKCSSEEVDPTVSRDIFEFRDSKKTSLFHSNNTSALLNNTNLSKKSDLKVGETSVHKNRKKRNTSVQSQKRVSQFILKKSSSKKLFPTSIKPQSPLRNQSPIVRRMKSERVLQFKDQIDDKNFLMMKKPQTSKALPPNKLTVIRRSPRPSGKEKKKMKLIPSQIELSVEINVQQLMGRLWSQQRGIYSDIKQFKEEFSKMIEYLIVSGICDISSNYQENPESELFIRVARKQSFE